MPMNEAQSALADRVRALLADEPHLTEKAMFGSRAFLLDEKIVVAVFTSAVLLVRVSEDDGPLLALEPGASPALMGPQRRPMGPGWLTVEPEYLADDGSLLSWVDAARAFHRARDS